MPNFTYRGVTSAGGQVRAEITAPDERAAARQLRSQGIVVQNIAVKRGVAGKVGLGELRAGDEANIHQCRFYTRPEAALT